MEKNIALLGQRDDNLKEYIVTLKSMDDSEQLYADMESENVLPHVPNRAVECLYRRPISRNTHYNLTYDEALKLLDDPRVLSVQQPAKQLGMTKSTTSFRDTSTYSKSVASSSYDLNWGLLRCTRTEDLTEWGVDGTSLTSTATVESSLTGRNVDVVIMDDATPYPTVLEYAQHSDGTGFSRMVEYDWHIHSLEVTGTAASSKYPYPSHRAQVHSGHTSGTVAGNSQGWARDANIYNITYDDSIDYVRAFHANKEVNPLTGVKNPTVMNNSWGYGWGGIVASMVNTVVIRGTTYTRGAGWPANFFTETCRCNLNALPAVNPAADADLIDAMNEGVIVVASAGNANTLIVDSGSADYNNYLEANFVGTVYFNRGPTPAYTTGGNTATRVVCVGAIGQHNETLGSSVYASTGIEKGDYKAEFSNYGSRVDVWAPGSGIQSVWNSSEVLYDGGAATDPRCAILGETDVVNNNFKKCPGTSMSGPQVAGMLACLAGNDPTMTQADAHAYIRGLPANTMLNGTGSKYIGIDNDANSGRRVMTLIEPVSEHEKTRYQQTIPLTDTSTRGSQTIRWPRVKRDYTARPTYSIVCDKESINTGETATFTINTTNTPDGTKMPYIITGAAARGLPKPAIDHGASGIFDFTAQVEGTENFTTQANTGWRVTLDGYTVDGQGLSHPTGTCTRLSSAEFLGRGVGNNVTYTHYAQDGTQGNGVIFSGNKDDGMWTVDLPFDIHFLEDYSANPADNNKIGICTNSFLTLNLWTDKYLFFAPDNPTCRKILMSAGDNHSNTIFTTTVGTAPNRCYHIEYLGGTGTGNYQVTENPIQWELTFLEQNPEVIEIRIKQNGMWYPSTSVYPITPDSFDQPQMGYVEINNNTATLPLTVTNINPLDITVRLGITPAPSVDLKVNH